LKRYRQQYESHLEQYAVPADELVARCTKRLSAHPGDPEALHQRGHALRKLRRFEEALADFAAASARRPLDAHLRACRGVCLLDTERYAPALDQLERAFRADPETVRAIINLNEDIYFVLNEDVNLMAWKLANGALPRRDPPLAARLAAFAVAISPGEQASLNTLGVALYRAGRFDQAIEALEKSLKAGNGQYDGFDLFVLAMVHHRLGHRAQGRACFDRATHWMAGQKVLSSRHVQELTDFRAEADSLFRSPAGELPADVFSNPR
jgi:tetratricopeptide (TPR) repeat protein